MLLNLLYTFSVLVAYVQATALTFALQPNEKQCFYIFNNKQNSNVGYYFAVQAGGSFDINYYIKAPNGVTIVQADKLTHADYIFTADQVGEYEFCLSNEMSTFAEKIVDFEVKVDDDFKASLPDAPKENEAVEGMQKSVKSIEQKMNMLTSALNYYKTRNNRNQSTVKSTESRIFWFSIVDLVLMVSISVFQVLVVKYFFQGSRKQMV
ncbi:DEKNAAC103553 [Brettanomyces naardenensis]|uniref:DEKNAAC103553 n=1 Tax=Brettanomyces naardenensis TaxID=13370 RepID=A0A448YN87_BRENA|nr:DEKNAAC103553 [Brettanomyces naardenensis]